jgi:hypothetical protein
MLGQEQTVIMTLEAIPRSFLTISHLKKIMHELAEALADRKGLAWIAVTAFFYVLVLVPFNQYHQEVFFSIALRPAAVVPVVAGILRGPAAAWGPDGGLRKTFPTHGCTSPLSLMV